MTSINLTVHNKGFLLELVLSRIKQMSTGVYELIIVLDGCTDNSESIAQHFCRMNPQIKSTILYAPNVFETKANNMAAKASTGDNIIIVQDDMVMNEVGWNERLIKPIQTWDDVFAVTARTAHNWIFTENSKHRHLSSEQCRIYHPDEWCDILTHCDHAMKTNTPRDTFAIRDCVNRGPLAIRHGDLQTMGYFDEQFSPQDMDDHDLCYRMKRRLGKKVGLYWIDFISEDNWGGTRQNGKPKRWLLEANQKNVRHVYKRHVDYIKNNDRTIEERRL